MRILLTAVFLFTSVVQASQPSKRILMVLTGASELPLKNGEIHTTGYWLEEFAVPYQIFKDSGFQITIATPTGKHPTMDEASAALGKDGKPLSWPSLAELNKALAVKRSALDDGKVEPLNRMTDRELERFDAVFFPGGHGPMADMISNTDVAKVLKHFHGHKKPTALVCHAPAALASTAGAGFPYKGYRVTAFTDSEEAQNSFGAEMVTTPERELKKAGMQFIAGPDWKSHVVEDHELITGQNPSSSKAIAEALVRRLAGQP